MQNCYIHICSFFWQIRSARKKIKDLKFLNEMIFPGEGWWRCIYNYTKNSLLQGLYSLWLFFIKEIFKIFKLNYFLIYNELFFLEEKWRKKIKLHEFHSVSYLNEHLKISVISFFDTLYDLQIVQDSLLLASRFYFEHNKRVSRSIFRLNKKYVTKIETCE